MNKFLVLLFLFSNIMITHTQWLNDFRLTNNPDSSLTSPNNARCIAALGGTVHAAWFDNRDGNYEIYYKRSTDDGAAWSSDMRLTTDNAVSQRPSIAVAGSFVHLVWNDRVSNEEIYYKRSTDAGLTWEANVRLTNNANLSMFPSVCVAGSVINVFWAETRDGNYEIYNKRSTDNGVTWSADIRLTNDGGTSIQSACAALGLIVHVTWNDNRHGPDEIYYKRSTDAGETWSTDTRLTSNAGVSWFSSVDAAGNNVMVSWVEQSDGNPEIYSRRSTDMGVTWEPNVRQTNNAATSIRPTISLSGNLVHIVYQDNVDGNEEIYYKASSDGGLTFASAVRLTNNNDISVYPCHAISSSSIHVVWRDFREGNWEVFYKRNPAGNLTLLTNLSFTAPEQFKLSQNYPNPFNPETNIEFSLPKRSFVKIVVYDILGKEIGVLVNKELPAGQYNTVFDAISSPGGVYFYRISADGFHDVKKMILIK